MGDQNEPERSRKKLTRAALSALVALQQQGSVDVSYDADADRYRVKVTGQEIATLKPGDVWHESIEQLEQRLTAAIIGHFGDRRPRSIPKTII